MSDLDTFEHDTRDNCDAYALLDDLPVRALDECDVCGAHQCRHYCGFCRVTRPCPCDEGGEISQREFRQMAARYDGAPARRRP